MFEKILIANRGEIALRIMHTARRLGIKTVAVYSEADASALFVQEADEAYFIGPSPSGQSYLNRKNIMAAIRESGADAVHPGYGFLSENPEFARAVTRAGVTFIGPTAKAITSMGDKLEAKKIAQKAGVNTIPGSEEAISDPKEARKIAKKIGYPVIIKAAAGGGGKGMRVVHSDKEIDEAIRASMSEAGSSFGDERVFVEKFIEDPRHIEIQLLSDNHGNIVTLGERECSIQRRHQKVIEEAPSPFIDEKTRKAMCDQAVALAKAVDYRSAGTVECIVDKHRNFYFLEMNTRLQVEHRVTELITGVDLVEQMIRIAAGEKLSFSQKDVTFNGWAFEARIYAEDPSRGFLPSVGRISRYQEPDDIPGMVLDSGVYEGTEVSMFYDPMVAKLCTHNQTRQQAIDDMKTALGAYVIRGIAHNISFLEAILNHPRFVEGNLSTHFIAEEYPDGFSGAELTSESSKIFIATAVFMHLRYRERDALINGQLPSRIPPFINRWVVQLGEEQFAVDVEPRETGYDIRYDDEIITVRSNWQLGRRLFQGTVNGKSVSVKVKRMIEGYEVTYGGSSFNALVRTPRVADYAKHMPERQQNASQKELTAPLAGMIVAVRAGEGDSVKPGAPLLMIEAMKMENIITAEYPVKVKKVHANEGQSVEMGQLLMEFE